MSYIYLSETIYKRKVPPTGSKLLGDLEYFSRLTR